MTIDLRKVSRYSAYTDQRPPGTSSRVNSMLLHASDNLRQRHPTGVDGIVACPPGRFWGNHKSIRMYTFLPRKLTLGIVDSLIEALLDQYLDSSILPDIRPLKVKSVEEVQSQSPDIFRHLSKLGCVLYDVKSE